MRKRRMPRRTACVLFRSCGSLRVRFLEYLQETGIYTRQSVDDGLRPVEVLDAPLEAPVLRRTRRHVPQIADFIRELDERAVPAHVPCVFNLKALTFHLRLRLVVGHLHHQVSDISTEFGYELVGRRFGVFNRVVERGRSQNSGIADAAVYAEHVHQGDRVVDVGACVTVFAALHPVLSCRELDGSNYETDVVGGLLHARSVAAVAAAWPMKGSPDDRGFVG